MANIPKLLTRFRVSDSNLEKDPMTKEAYGVYSDKRYELGKARKALNETSKKLHDLLDGPLRSSGLVPQGKDWTLTEDEEELGLIIYVWSGGDGSELSPPAYAATLMSFLLSNVVTNLFHFFMPARFSGI